MTTHEPSEIEQPTPPEPEAAAASERSRTGLVTLLAVGIALGLAVVVLQVLTLRAANDARSVAADANDNAVAAAGAAGSLRGEVDALAGAVEEISGDLEAAAFSGQIDAGGSSSLQTTEALPAYPQSGADPAVQAAMRLPAITGDEYYSGERLTFAPDGTNATVWLVWAHWCPYCQRELPELAELISTAADDYPHVQVVTVTSSIDPTRGNPLEAYLDTSDFPFPVLVDATGSLASVFGTNAYPFWVITDPDGRVLLRQPGAFGVDQLPGLFASVEEFVTS